MSIKHHFHGCQKRRWYVLRLLSGAISSTWLYLYLYLSQPINVQVQVQVQPETKFVRYHDVTCLQTDHTVLYYTLSYTGIQKIYKI